MTHCFSRTAFFTPFVADADADADAPFLFLLLQPDRLTMFDEYLSYDFAVPVVARGAPGRQTNDLQPSPTSGEIRSHHYLVMV